MASQKSPNDFLTDLNIPLKTWFGFFFWLKGLCYFVNYSCCLQPRSNVWILLAGMFCRHSKLSTLNLFQPWLWTTCQLVHSQGWGLCRQDTSSRYQIQSSCFDFVVWHTFLAMTCFVFLLTMQKERDTMVFINYICANSVIRMNDYEDSNNDHNCSNDL